MSRYVAAEALMRPNTSDMDAGLNKLTRLPNIRACMPYQYHMAS